MGSLNSDKTQKIQSPEQLPLPLLLSLPLPLPLPLPLSLPLPPQLQPLPLPILPPLKQQLPIEQQKLNQLFELQLLYPLYTRKRDDQLPESQPQPQPQPQYPLPVNSELPQPLSIRDLASVIEYVKNKNYPLYVREETQLQLPAHYLNAGQLLKPQQQYPLFGLGNELPQPSIGYSPHITSIIEYVKENKIPQPPPKEKSDIEREEEIIDLISKLKEQIQNGRNINESDNFGQTILIRSVIDERYQVTKTLLRTEQVDVNAVDHMNNSALHYASSQSNADIIKAFANRKDVNFNAFAGNHNATALQIAAKNGFDEVVQALIDAKASVDICNSDKHTALHVAVFFGKESVVKVLLKAGADVDKRDINGKTALDIAKNIIEDETKRDIIIKLLTANKVNLKKSEDKAPLEDKATPAGEKSKKRRYTRTAPDDLNEHPANNLRIASLECNFDEVRKLLKEGANPNWTPIKGDHLPIALVALSTSKKGDYEKIKIITLLYKYGADIDPKYFDNLFNDNVITKSLRENIKKLSTENPQDFSVEKFLESLQKPCEEGVASNKRPSNDTELARENKAQRLEGAVNKVRD